MVEIATPRGSLTFVCPTARSLHDPTAFGQDEPETVRWIDTWLRPGEVVWDIGANIGLYSLYAALDPAVRVLAFEPGAASFALLVRNIEANHCSNVAAYALAFSDATALDLLYMENTAAGHSMHAFAQRETVAKRLDPVFAQSALGFSIDDFFRIFDPPPPTHIKLDVDSIEAKVIRGGRETLRSVRSVLVEIASRQDYARRTGVAQLLVQAGFVPQEDANQDARRNYLFARP